MAHKHVALLVVAAFWLFQLSHAYKHHLEVTKDSREQFFIESFGFKTGGVFYMNVSDFQVVRKSDKKVLAYTEYQNEVYFLLLNSYIDMPELLQNGVDYKCRDTWSEKNAIPLYSNWQVNTEYKSTITADRTGLYNLYFINCFHKETHVTFKLKLEQYNYDKNVKDYLPVGLSPVPTIYAMFAVVYFILFVIWVFGYMRGQGNILNKVHYLMTLLLVLYILYLFFFSVEQHFVKYNGKPGGWEIAYYIFAVLKTSLFFVIVTLIGTGWSFFKPFLSDKDKKIIMVVVPLQILDNVAMIIVGVDNPGSQGLFTWRDIFRLVDIICCGAVLIPIIWSIKHLREASQSDGKAAKNLQKLRLFRQFYLIVVSYIYFTRIIIYLLDATLQYDLAWLGPTFTELATLCFFVVVGYKFRPINGNPYFNIEEEDAARSEDMRSTEME